MMWDNVGAENTSMRRGIYRVCVTERRNHFPSLSHDFTLHTERGCLSVTRFCYSFLSELRGPAWEVGTYSIGNSAGELPKT